MLKGLLLVMLLAAPPTTKLSPPIAKEMREAIVAVNKALGLESWMGKEVCVDRGGLEATIKDVKAEDAKKCAESAVVDGFPGLGKDYVLGIPMAAIGPVTVFAIGLGDSDGYGAYSCDPKRTCNPTRLDAKSKQAKRLVARYERACADSKTLWLPDRNGVCPAK